jgi:hypothetical protein
MSPSEMHPLLPDDQKLEQAVQAPSLADCKLPTDKGVKQPNQLLGLSGRLWLVAMVWLTAGSLFYRYQAQFAWSQAVFFAVQAPLIGFGADNITCSSATGWGG